MLAASLICNLIASLFPNSIPKSLTNDSTTNLLQWLITSWSWLFDYISFYVICFKLLFKYKFFFFYNFVVWIVFIMWFKMFTPAAVRVIYSKWNHYLRWCPFIYLCCRAYPNNMCTNAYNFFWYNVLTVNIYVISMLSSRYHWNIRCWGGFCLVLPILIQ